MIEKIQHTAFLVGIISEREPLTGTKATSIGGNIQRWRGGFYWFGEGAAAVPVFIVYAAWICVIPIGWVVDLGNKKLI